MPIWAYIYCFLVCCGAVYSFADEHRLRTWYQPVAEIVNCLSYIAIFLIAYRVLNLPNASLVASLLLLYIVFWASFAYKRYLSPRIFIAEVREGLLKSGRRQQSLNTLNRQSAELDLDKLALKFYLATVLFIAIVFSPVVYVYRLILTGAA